MTRRWLYTSESVTERHPDKMADQVSDAILDAIMTDDPFGRVACETLITTGLVCVAGEITTATYIDIPSIVRKTIIDIGYTRAKYGFDGETCGIAVSIQDQSPDIAIGVDHARDERPGDAEQDLDADGAGDGGRMVGDAGRGTDTLIPLPIWLTHGSAPR